MVATVPIGHHHDLAGGVVGGGDARRGLVLGAPVGLAVEVAGVGVAAVATQVGEDVGAHGDGLRLELLEAPVLALRTGAPSAAQLDGDSPGTVSATYCSSGRVLTVRACAARVVERRQCAVHRGAAARRRKSWRSPPLRGEAVGVVWLVEHRGPGPAQPGAGVDFPGRAASGGTAPPTRSAHPGADTPAASSR